MIQKQSKVERRISFPCEYTNFFLGQDLHRFFVVGLYGVNKGRIAVYVSGPCKLKVHKDLVKVSFLNSLVQFCFHTNKCSAL